MITCATCIPCGPNSLDRPCAKERSALLAAAKAVNGGLDRIEAVAPVKSKEPPSLRSLGIAS